MKNAIINNIISTMTGLTKLSTDVVGDVPDKTATMAKSVCGSLLFSNISAVAVSLCVLFILIHLVEETMQGKGDPEYIIKSIGFYCVICAIIINMDTVTTALIDAFKNIMDVISDNGDNLIKIIQNGNGTQAATFDPETMREELKKENIMVLIFDMLLYWIFGSLGTIIISVVAKVVVFTLELTILVETFILPLALAQLPEGGWNGIGGKAIRTYFASWLAFGVLSIVLSCYQILLVGNFKGAIDFIIALFAATFACIGMGMKATNVAKEIVT